MDAVNGFKVFRMNDCDWYLGRTPEEATAALCADVGSSFEDEYVADDCPEEMTEAELDERRIRIDCGNGDHISRTYREQLLAEPPSEPCMFASTEY